MQKIFVTTFNKILFDKYAHKLIDTYLLSNQSLPLYCYVEDDINLYPKEKNVFYINLFETQPECKKFVERNFKKNKEISKKIYLLDAVRFSYKVFAQNDSRKYGNHIFYVDSDVIFQKKIPDLWFNECLPDDVFISLYDRIGYYTETGFLAINNNLKNSFNYSFSDMFFQIYLGYYKNDTIYNLPAFTDCHALDATRYKFKLLQPHVVNYRGYKEKRLGDTLSYFRANVLDIMGSDNFTKEYILHNKGYKA